MQCLVLETEQRASLLARIQTQVVDKAKPKGFRNQHMPNAQNLGYKGDGKTPL
jgi:hypothetical protein